MKILQFKAKSMLFTSIAGAGANARADTRAGDRARAGGLVCAVPTGSE